MEIHELETLALTSPAYVAADDGSNTYKFDFNAIKTAIEGRLSSVGDDADAAEEEAQSKTRIYYGEVASQSGTITTVTSSDFSTNADGYNYLVVKSATARNIVRMAVGSYPAGYVYVNGAAGSVPFAAGECLLFRAIDVTYDEPTPVVQYHYIGKIYQEATTSDAGLMSAADKSALDDVVEDVTDLKSGIKAYESAQGAFYPSDFVNGTLSNGNLSTNVKYRVACTKIFSFDEDTLLTVDSGFRFAVHWFSNDTFSFDGGYFFDGIFIKANTQFKLFIARTSEVTSEVADIATFTSAIHIRSAIENELYTNLKDTIGHKYAWTRYSDGASMGSGNYLHTYYFPAEQFTFVEAMLYAKDANSAAIAFYSSDTFDTASYMKSDSVQMVSGFHYYHATVPNGCKFIALTTRTDYNSGTDTQNSANIEQPINVKTADIGFSAFTDANNAEYAIDMLANDFKLPLFRKTISGETYKEIYVNIPAGNYTISMSSIISSDSDDTQCRVIFSNGSTTVLDTNFNRGVSIEYNAVFSNAITKITFYAATNYAKSDGDTFTFNNFIIMADTPLKESINGFSEVRADVVRSLAYSETAGYFNGWGGIESAGSSTQEVYTQAFPVVPGQKIRWSYSYTNGSHNMWLATATYDKAKTFITRTALVNQVGAVDFSGEITIPDGTYFIAFTYRTYGTTNGLTLNINYSYENISYLYEKGISNGVNYDTPINSVNHRGYNTVAPENTLPAYKLSKRNGFNIVETDVRFTSDGVAVLLHDKTVDRTSNGTGEINSMTYAQARELDFGSWKSSAYTGTKIPSFEEFLLLCKNLNLYAYAEIQPTTKANVIALINLARSCGMIRKVTWISFYPEMLGYAVMEEPTARVGVNASDGIDIDAVKMLRSGLNDVFVNYAADTLTSAIISDCQTAKVPLEVWTVDSESGITALDGYITGVTSDNLVAEKILYDANIE